MPDNIHFYIAHMFPKSAIQQLFYILRPLPPVPKFQQDDEVYEDMTDYSTNQRYSAAPSLLAKSDGKKFIRNADMIERGPPDGGEGNESKHP